MADVSKRLRVSVDLHQGTTLSSLLFALLMNTVARGILRPAPYTLLYVDFSFLVFNNQADLEQLRQK